MVAALLAIGIVTQIFLFLVFLQWLNQRFEDFRDGLNELTNILRQFTEGNNTSVVTTSVSPDGNSRDYRTDRKTRVVKQL